MFLSGEAIKALCNDTEDSLISPPVAEDNIQQASCDLCLGAEAYLVGSDSPVRLSADKERYLKISPGEFALLMTEEHVHIPKTLVAFITVRNSFKLQGLVNITGFHVDPTYRGRIIYGVNNAGPSDIRLRLGEPTFSIFFSKVEGEVKKQRKPGAEQLPLEYVQLLGGSSVTLAKLQSDFDELKRRVNLYAPLGIALLIALILNLLKGGSGK